MLLDLTSMFTCRICLMPGKSLRMSAICIVELSKSFNIDLDASVDLGVNMLAYNWLATESTSFIPGEWSARGATRTPPEDHSTCVVCPSRAALASTATARNIQGTKSLACFRGAARFFQALLGSVQGVFGGHVGGCRRKDAAAVAHGGGGRSEAV
ncbi:hypothetical protein EJ03DRAFT_120594 [Teratosphaeria nubilosa]|uniref:Uncharacterized protein n=1 Tax=Teratosphaeria nubilosa TaxID=161662 RepID=A0A6G1L5Z6_9PEZI|nr:hypothetical protein EJ03DRAFT_120594 [Teratosphaeria nubilosa]